MLLLQAQQVLRLPLPLPSLHIPHQLSHPTTILPHLRYLASLNRLNLFILREVKLQHLLYILDIRSALLFSSPELPQPFSTTPGIQWTVLKQWSVHECWQQWIRTISECSSTSTRPCGWWTPTCWTLAIPSSTLRWSSKCSWWISSKIGGVLNCLTNPPLISGNESISNRRLPAAATRFNWRSCSYCTRIPSTV